MARRRRKELSDRQALVVTLLVFFAAALAGTWIFSDGLRDAQDVKWIQCEVVDAKSQRGGRYATVPWYVVVHTSDCGNILYQVGTPQNNVDGLAANFVPGPYEFKLGAVSQRRIEGDTLLNHASVAKDVRQLPVEVQ